MAKITRDDSRANGRRVVQARTQSTNPIKASLKWWKGSSKADRAKQLIETALFLRESNASRYKQAAMYARLYGNMPLHGMLGGGLQRMGTQSQLPIDRPTMNVIQSCVDTLVSRLSQSRPRPIFLTDGGDYKERNLSKQLNQFILGELYKTDAHEKVKTMLRDAAVLGTGVLKVLAGQDERVRLERVLPTELLVDPNDGMYGEPRQIIQMALMSRDVLMEMFPDKKASIEQAEQAYPDNSADSSHTVSDQVLVVEGWHLPSGPDAKDGKHIIAISGVNDGNLHEEDYTKQKFPFVFLQYSPRLLGFFGQSLAEQLMGTQMEINKLLITISSAINLVGVPRVFVEDGSKVVKAHLNNQVGAIVTYRGTKPEYTVAPCVPAEMYSQLQRLVDYSYQQSGISAMSAASQKPSGLDSGQAIREYDDLQSDRFADLNRRYDNTFIQLSYLMIDTAIDIAKATGHYGTIYPNKNGVKEVDLPKAAMLKDSFVIQCQDASMLPKDPAGRKQTIIEDMQAGLLTPDEARRQLDYPDLEQHERLANAEEERVLKILDQIVEEGKYTAPDGYLDPALCIKLSKQYINLYVENKLEDDRFEMLRTFNTQAQALATAMMPPPAPMAPGGGPQAAPAAPPVSPMLPNAPKQ